MEYCFNFKIQAMYGLLAFVLVLAIVYAVTKEIDWSAATIVGIVNFAISGYYTQGKCR